jgi:vitamin B12 transporter
MGLNMKSNYLPLVAAFLSTTFLPLGNFAFAEEAVVDNIVVTANRREQPLSDVGSSVSVLTDLDLIEGQYVFVLDALATVPGVAISQSGSFGGTASVSIRGAGGDKTLVFVDGVRMNDLTSPGSGYDFANLDPYNIERIEVLRGPQSVLYGSDAIGGVVNVITKTGGEGYGGSAFAEVGSFETVRAGASVFGGSRELGFNLSMSGTHTEGISTADEADGNTEKDGFYGFTVSGKVTARPSDNIRASLLARYSDNRTDFDSFGPVDGDEEANLAELLVSARARLTGLNGKLSNTFSVEYASTDRENFTNGVLSFEGEGERKTVDYLGVLEITPDWTLTAGAQHELAEAKTIDPQSITTNSVLGELAFEGIDGLVITGGGRYVDHETFGDTTTARATASYTFADTGTRFITNWAQGFKSPSIFQITYICTWCGLTEPTPNLQPETSEGYEFGIEQDLLGGRLVLGATWFHLDSEGAIVFTFSDGYQNLGRSESKGLEVTFWAELLDGLELSANYTQNDAIDKDTGSQLIRQPEHAAFAALDWAVTESFSASLMATYNGEEFDFGGSQTDAWTRIDLRAAWDLTEAVQFYARVDNLFDEDYQHTVGYGTPGRSGFIGVRTNW